MYLSLHIKFLCLSLDNNLLGKSDPYLSVLFSALCGNQISVLYSQETATGSYHAPGISP